MRNDQHKQADALAREFVFERDRFRCVYCGKGTELGRIEWAHIVTRGMGGGNRYIRWEPANAVTLHTGCHAWFTEHPADWRAFIAEKYGPDHWDSLLRMQAEAERRGDRVDVENVIRGFRERQLTAEEMETYRSGAWLG